MLSRSEMTVRAACREKELRRIADGGLRAPGRVAPQAPDDEDLEAHLLQREAGCAGNLGLGFYFTLCRMRACMHTLHASLEPAPHQLFDWTTTRGPVACTSAWQAGQQAC